MTRFISQTKQPTPAWEPAALPAAPVEPPALTDAAIQAELITLRLAVAEAGKAAHEQRLALYAQLERYRQQAVAAAELPSIRAAARRFLGSNKKE